MDSWERFTAGRGVSKLRVVWGVSVFIALRAYTRPGNAPPSSRAGGGMAWLWQGFLRRACAFSENGFSPLRVCFLSKFLRNLSDFSSKTIRRLVTAVSLMTATRLTQVYQTLKPAPLSILQPGLLPSARRAPANLSPHPYCKFVRTVTVFQHEISYRGFCFRSKFRKM